MQMGIGSAINNNINMNIHVMNPSHFDQQANLLINAKNDYIEEINNLKSINSNLRLKLDEIQLKSNTNINETAFLKSKCYKNLEKQAEENATIVDELKELYYKLKRSMEDNNSNLDNEIKKAEQNFLRNNENYRKKYEETKQELILTKKKLQESSSNNLLAEAKVYDFDSVYKYFESEKKRMSDEIKNLFECLELQKKKVEKEVNENLELTEKYNKILLEFDEYKSNKPDLNLQLELNESLLVDDRDKKYKHKIKEQDEIIRSKKEKIMILEKKIVKLQEELNSEKELTETLSRELQANESGVNETMTQIKVLHDQISNENQKVAKLTNEKLNDQRNLDKLNQEREANIKLTEIYKLQKIEAENQRNILLEQNNILKSVIDGYNSILKNKDEEIIKLEKNSQNAKKAEMEIESKYNQEKSLIDTLTTNNSNLKCDLELYTMKYNTSDISLNEVGKLKSDVEAYKVRIYHYIENYLL